MKIDYRDGIKALTKEYKHVTLSNIAEGINWRRKIESNNLSRDESENLLRDIIGQILVQGRSAKGVETQLDNIEQKIGKWDLANIENNLDDIIKRKDKKGRITRKYTLTSVILKHLKDDSIRKWILGLLEDDANIPHLGPKSDADFLKEHGFYERVPIDRHTQRFLFRTGILHWFFKKNRSEDVFTIFAGSYPQRIRLLERCLVEFCGEFCSDVYFESPIGKLRLSENPGIIDIIIWRHCGEDEKLGCANVCGIEPRCNICVFGQTCLWDRLSQLIQGTPQQSE